MILFFCGVGLLIVALFGQWVGSGGVSVAEAQPAWTTCWVVGILLMFVGGIMWA